MNGTTYGSREGGIVPDSARRRQLVTFSRFPSNPTGRYNTIRVQRMLLKANGLKHSSEVTGGMEPLTAPGRGPTSSARRCRLVTFSRFRLTQSSYERAASWKNLEP